MTQPLPPAREPQIPYIVWEASLRGVLSSMSLDRLMPSEADRGHLWRIGMSVMESVDHLFDNSTETFLLENHQIKKELVNPVDLD